MLIFVQFVLAPKQQALNTNRTKSMIIGSSWKLSNVGTVTIPVNSSTVENVESFSYLNMTLSSNKYQIEQRSRQLVCNLSSCEKKD